MTQDEKNDLILKKLSELELRVSHLENNNAPRTTSSFDSYYITVIALCLVGFIALYNILLFVVEIVRPEETKENNMLVSFGISALITAIAGYVKIYDRYQSKKQNNGNEDLE